MLAGNTPTVSLNPSHPLFSRLNRLNMRLTVASVYPLQQPLAVLWQPELPIFFFFPNHLVPRLYRDCFSRLSFFSDLLFGIETFVRDGVPA